MEEALKLPDFNPALRGAKYATAAILPLCGGARCIARGDAVKASTNEVSISGREYAFRKSARRAARSGEIAAAETDAAELARLHTGLQGATRARGETCTESILMAPPLET
jgi:hypothetical protein